MRAKLLAAGQPLLQTYFSDQGFTTLLPLDLILVMYTVSIILMVVTLRVLAEAQLSVEENPERGQTLAAKAEKYIEWVLNAVVFFMALEYLSTLTSFYMIFQDSYWAAMVLCVIVALCARYVMRKVLKI